MDFKFTINDNGKTNIEYIEDVIAEDISKSKVIVVSDTDKEVTSPLQGFLESLENTPQEIQQETNLTIYHGKATDTLARLTGATSKIDAVTGKAVVDNGEIKVVIQRFNEQTANLNITTNKLLYYGISQFTNNNNYTNLPAVDNKLNYDVVIPLDNYLRYCGYDIDPKDTTEAEKKRAKNNYDNGRKEVKKHLELLANMELSWEEKVKGKVGDYLNIRIIGTRGIKHGYIYMTFDPKMAEYLVKLPLTQYPVSLLGISVRDANAYHIGLKLTEHYNNDNNITIGTYNRLKVSSILNVTNLPTDEQLKERKELRKWVRYIKEPLEKALDVLKHNGTLLDWEYIGANDTPLTYEEASKPINDNDYYSWSNFYLKFTLANSVDHSKRLTTKSKNKSKHKKAKGVKNK